MIEGVFKRCGRCGERSKWLSAGADEKKNDWVKTKLFHPQP
jgi:hypothetical protein